ncbi:MAG: AraC family transcriptional regulator [Pseudomonadota bacterium]
MGEYAFFDQLHANAEPFALCQLHGQCVMNLDKSTSATLHYVLVGRGQIEIAGRKPFDVEPGSLVLIPALRTHSLRSFGELSAHTPECRPASLDIAGYVHGDVNVDHDRRLIAICSRMSLSFRNLHRLIDLVREPIVETVDSGSLLAMPLETLLHELASPGPGSGAIIRSLLLVCAIDMLRRRLSSNGADLGWMKVLHDPKLWPALQSMLDDPGETHSLDSLAEAAGMSRSAFAKRFGDAFGCGPMELLRELRMQRAAALLVETDAPVKRIADLSGFRSRSAFSRAFEAAMGFAPQIFRDRDKVE